VDKKNGRPIEISRLMKSTELRMAFMVVTEAAPEGGLR
jgi:hypothetical protein